MEKNITGVGRLTNYHIFYVMAMIGLILPCSFAYAEFGPAVSTLDEKYSNLLDHKNPIEASYRVLKAASHQLEITMSTVENVLCMYVQEILQKKKQSRAWKYTITPNQEYLYVYDQDVCDIVQYSCRNKIEAIDRPTIIRVDYSLLKVYDSMKDLGKSSDRLPRKE